MAVDDEVLDPQALADAEEQARQERRDHLASLGLRELFAEASDDELRQEQLRVGREFERPTQRIYSISEEEAQRRLEHALGRMDGYYSQAIERVRKEIVERHDGPLPQTIAAALVAWEARQQHGNFLAALAAAAKPDGQRITEADLRAEAGQRRRELDERRSAISAELFRRDAVRRGLVPDTTSKGVRR